MAHTAFIDLSRGSISLVPTQEQNLDRFLGGRGLGAYLLFQLAGKSPAPFSPKSPLIFTAGSFTGTAWPAAARGHVTFHSPLTGIYGYANTGGHFPAALRQAGFDALVITGQAPEPCVLDVSSEAIEVRPTAELWGLSTSETTRRLAGDDSSAKVACIGPAGENRVHIAGIINDVSRAAARAGGGAVMGSKNLKAIVVRKAPVQKTPPEFVRLAGQAARKLRAQPSTQGLVRFGTPLLITPQNAMGTLPARNHQQGQVDYVRQIDAQALERYVIGRRGCHACSIQCDHVTEVKDGAYATQLGGPEYETMDALGPMVGIGNLEAIIYANKLCNELGLDTISTGVCIAFAMECHQRGLLDDPELSLVWGDVASVHGLIERIAYRRGLGSVLADGVRAAVRQLGPATEPYAMHVKGMELPRQEPRVAKGFGLGHATSNRGADHLYALPTIDLAGHWEVARRIFPPDVVPGLMDADDETYKPDLVVFSEHYCAVSDALGVCKFSTAETYGLMPEDLAEGLSALRRKWIPAQDLLLAGERIVNLERLYNVRLGLSRADDRTPERFTTEPLPVYAISRDEATGGAHRSPEPVRHAIIKDFDAMLDRYYELRGWDSNGIPTPETLRRLGLDLEAASLSGM